MEESYKDDGTYVAKKYVFGVLQSINVKTKNGSMIETLFSENNLKIYEKIEKPSGEIIITHFKNGIRAYEQFKAKDETSWKYSVFDSEGKTKKPCSIF